MKQVDTLAVATLFEGGHEVGARALLNSLVAAGFRGSLWCGVRGVVPVWPEEVAGIRVRFVHLQTDMHLTHYKPWFLQQVLDADTAASGVVLFDSDIVVKCAWEFFEDWAQTGVAAAGDLNWFMPATSPVRARWIRLCDALGEDAVSRAASSHIDIFCNAGFVAVTRERCGFLTSWSKVIEVMVAGGQQSQAMTIASRAEAVMALDQDAFNVALMLHAAEVSLMGPEAMDFASGGEIMSHAVGAPKPWERRFVWSALFGRPPSKRDFFFLRFAVGPLPVFPPHLARRKLLAYRIARGIGWVWRRNDF